MNRTPLQLLAEYGQSPWLDALSRDLLSDGRLVRLVREHGIRGVTSNLSVFRQAICAGSGYDEQIRVLAAHGDQTPESITRTLSVSDTTHACDLMRPIWEESDGADGYVSVELDPRLADDSARLYEQARVVAELVERPNLMVKIPATAAGVYAVEDSIARGISTNVTLIFSLERYREVVQAYRRGIERLLESGGDPRRVASVATISVSSIDAEVERRLRAHGGAAMSMRRMVGIAQAKLVYAQYKEAFGSARWRALEARGARRQRCAWASAPTGYAAGLSVFYVEELIGAETVNAMSIETVQAFERHGVVADKVERGIEGAQRVVDEARAGGVDLDDVWTTLEADGVRALVESFEAVLATVSSKQMAMRRR